MRFTPGTLVRTVAEVLLLDDATVMSYYRPLRVARKTTYGGRGRSAPWSSSEDIAMLLTAILGGKKSINSAKTVERYAAMNCVRGFGKYETNALRALTHLLEGYDLPFATLSFHHEVGGMKIEFSDDVSYAYGFLSPVEGLQTIVSVEGTTLARIMRIRLECERDGLYEEA